MLRDNRNNCGSKGGVRLFIYTSQVHCNCRRVFIHFLSANQFPSMMVMVMVMVTFSFYFLFFSWFCLVFLACRIFFDLNDFVSVRVLAGLIVQILLNIHRMKLSTSRFGVNVYWFGKLNKCRYN